MCPVLEFADPAQTREAPSSLPRNRSWIAPSSNLTADISIPQSSESIKLLFAILAVAPPPHSVTPFLLLFLAIKGTFPVEGRPWIQQTGRSPAEQSRTGTEEARRSKWAVRLVRGGERWSWWFWAGRWEGV